MGETREVNQIIENDPVRLVESIDDRASENSQSPLVESAGPKRFFGFLRSKHFWFIVLHGQVLSWVIVCTNSLTTEINTQNTSIPAFQSMLLYNCLLVIFVPYTIYQRGWRYFVNLTLKDGWKFFLFAFADVEGNYFVVKAYEYTNILSASLLDNFAIVVVVILSFIFLKVRYHWFQYISIVLSIGGMALLIVSDHLMGHDYDVVNPVKGDLFVLLGAACYGVSNTLQEYFVSKRPVWEVLGQMGLWASIIIGVQIAIFERSSVAEATWNVTVGCSLLGYTLAMLLLYTTAPILFRMSSAAFYNLSLLTSDFWSLLIGTRVFGYHVYWLYPVGFVVVILGIVCYCAAPMTNYGESLKPWLGINQDKGIAGIGTARAKLQRQEEAANTTVETA